MFQTLSFMFLLLSKVSAFWWQNIVHNDTPLCAMHILFSCMHFGLKICCVLNIYERWWFLVLLKIRHFKKPEHMFFETERQGCAMVLLSLKFIETIFVWLSPKHFQIMVCL
jgi:hypothetical protein